jgi:hypothetical protein
MKNRLITCLVIGLMLGAISAPSVCYADSDAPWIPQTTTYDCGRAVLASLIAWSKNEGSQTAIHQYRQLPGPRNRMLSLSTIADELLTRKIAIDIDGPKDGIVIGNRPSISIQDLKAFLKKLRIEFVANKMLAVVTPVVRRGVRHYMVLLGEYPDGFYVYDPDSRLGGAKLKFSNDQVASMMLNKFDGIVLKVSKSVTAESEKINK